MTGEEHYKEAERLLESVKSCGNQYSPGGYVEAEHVATVGAAQVHATLALAAATQQVALDDDRIAGTVDESGTRLRIGAMPV